MHFNVEVQLHIESVSGCCCCCCCIFTVLHNECNSLSLCSTYSSCCHFLLLLLLLFLRCHSFVVHVFAMVVVVVAATVFQYLSYKPLIPSTNISSVNTTLSTIHSSSNALHTLAPLRRDRVWRGGVHFLTFRLRCSALCVHQMIRTIDRCERQQY